MPDHPDESLEAMENLVRLVCAYRGWSRRELARHMNRSQRNLVPDSGNPKVDLVVSLAKLLEWEPEMVLNAIDPQPGDNPDSGGRSYEDIRAAVLAARERGDPELMAFESQCLQQVARTNVEKAHGLMWEGFAWDGHGFYTRAIRCYRGALRLKMGPEQNVAAYSSIASAFLSLGHVAEATLVGQSVLRICRRHSDLVDVSRAAFGRYVCGAGIRRSLENEHSLLGTLEEAVECLEQAKVEFEETCTRLNDGFYGAMAQTTDAELLVCRTLDGTVDAGEAIEQVLTRLDRVVNINKCEMNELESYGWWCNSGCELAFMQSDLKYRTKCLAIFTNKGYEIADRVGNWAITERMFRYEMLHKKNIEETTGIQVPHALDEDDLRVIVGLMGRFPGFHEAGWEILRNASIVHGSARR